MDSYFMILYFFTYGFLGWCTEVAFAAVKQHKFVNRGFLNGPICPIYGIGVSAVILFLEPLEGNLVLLYAASVILVTLIEGVTGFAMDKLFHHKWWDYTGQPLNIGGYVCLLFSLVWGVACVVIVRFIHPLIDKVLAFLPWILGIVLIVVLLGVLAADLYVTASGILKLNRRLESMERIAAELKDLSNKVGAGIFENVMGSMDKLEDAAEEMKEKFGSVSEESRKRTEELKERYAQLASGGSRVSERLLKAFPKMESRRHRDILNELKEKLEDKVKRNH